MAHLPLVNACLNGAASVLLLIGLVLILNKRQAAHKRVMLGAFAVSCIFLVCYVTNYVWRASVQGGTHTRYNGAGVMAAFYYSMLISHILLAMLVPVFAIMLIYLGLKQRYATHRRLAKIAWPIWMYVSITGVLIYLMLYPFNPPPA